MKDRWNQEAEGQNGAKVPGKWHPKDPVAYAIKIYGRDYLKWFFPDAGSMIRPHTHTYEHTTDLTVGTFIVQGEAEGRNGIPITAPDVIRFAPGVEHSIKALTPEAICQHYYSPDDQVTDYA